MSTETFAYDAILSHSAKDKAVVRPLAERLWQDGRQGNAECRRQKAENLHSAFFLHPFPRDWAQLACPAAASERRGKVGTCGRGNLPFRDPLNQERRSLSELRPSTFAPRTSVDAPIKGSLAQFLYINWHVS